MTNTYEAINAYETTDTYEAIRYRLILMKRFWTFRSRPWTNLTVVGGP